MENKPIPVIDLFAGPGGLGEGFSAAGGRKRAGYFQVHLSIEKDSVAYTTLRLRSFFRKFPYGKAPKKYYDLLRGEIESRELFNKYPKEARAAENEVWCAELGGRKTPGSEVDNRIKHAIGNSDKWVLIGGPPCQAYSIIGRSRNRAVKGYRIEADKRHSLYQEYLRIIYRHWPPVFVMENVKGLLSSRANGNGLFSQILSDLKNPAAIYKQSNGNRKHGHRGYKIYSLVNDPRGIDLLGSPDYEHKDFVVKCEEHGIPQARHRIILLGIREDIDADYRDLLIRKSEFINTSRVLYGLPRLRSGISREGDNAAAWHSNITEALNSRWLKSARSKAGENVFKLLLSSISNLSLPRNDRGGEFIPCNVDAEYAPKWFLDPRIGGVCNHSTRGHIPKDLHRYLYAACFAKVKKYSPKLSDFPADLLPNHRNVQKALNGNLFSDRFRVQPYNRPASTITSHISKDGHYYIHPDPSQCRSLTVREAARLQTFPDNYFFAGNRTSQYVQVGNAVPPLLATQIAEIVRTVLGRVR